MHTIIGVMGGSVADHQTAAAAHRLGVLIAQRGWTLLNGGRDCGVMAASAAGAREGGGLVVGVLPGEDRSGIASAVDIPILTGMGDARNVINVLSSRVVIAMAGGAGTISEIAHALKLGRPVVTLGMDTGSLFAQHSARGELVSAQTPDEAVAAVAAFLGKEAS